MALNKKSFAVMENVYLSYMSSNVTDNKLCRDLEILLSGLPFDNGKKTFSVSICNKNRKDSFFGMRVFPNVDKLDAFCEEILTGSTNGEMVPISTITKRWKNIDSWILEIDDTIFDKSFIVFTARELVALTLHEIGHVIYSDRPIESFWRAYKEARLRMEISDRAVQKLMYSIYSIPMAIACMQRRWTSKNSNKIEIVADRTVLELGYGSDLVSALNKILRQCGSITTDDNANTKEVETAIIWCNKNVNSVQNRKEHLKDEIYYQTIKTNSNYFKALGIIVLDKLGFKLKNRFTGVVTENTIELLCDSEILTKYSICKTEQYDKFYAALETFTHKDIAMESIFNRRKKIKAELPSQYELDSIAIEIDKITNHADRMFVLDLIYEVMEKVQLFEEAISVDPKLVSKWDYKVSNMKNELERYRRAVLEKKISDRKYKFFVKLPDVAADYEG